MLNKDFEKFIKNRNQTTFKIDDYIFVKVKYDDDFDYIFDGYNDFNFNSSYNSKIELIGLLDYKTNKLHLTSDYRIGKYADETLIGDTLYSITSAIYRDLNNRYNEYVYKHMDELKSRAQKVYDTYYSYSENILSLKSLAEDIYLSMSNINEPYKYQFKYSNYTENYSVADIKPIVAYLKHKDIFIDDVINTEINSEKVVKIHSNTSGIPSVDATVAEELGFILLKADAINKYIQEFKKDTKSFLNLKRKIRDCLDLDKMKTVNITVKHNDKELTFKYPVDTLYRFSMSDWNVPDLDTRAKYKDLFSDLDWYKSDENVIKCITKITYGKNILFEK